MARIRVNRAKYPQVMAQITNHSRNHLFREAEDPMARPQKLPSNIDEQLLRHLGNTPDGLRTDQLATLIGDVISRRTLQRRLSQLVDIGRLISQGGGRST